LSNLFGGPQNLAQAYQDVNYSPGKHGLRFGGSYLHLQDNRTFGNAQNAKEILSLNTLANALNNIVSGQLQAFTVAIDPQGKFPGDRIDLPVGPPSFSRNNRFNEFALYLNDSWRILHRVTLNLGLRYEYFGVQHNKDPRLDSNFYLGNGSTIFEQIRNGSVLLAPESPVGKLYKPDTNNFAPRIGFAWDVLGNGKTSPTFHQSNCPKLWHESLSAISTVVPGPALSYNGQPSQIWRSLTAVNFQAVKHPGFSGTWRAEMTMRNVRRSPPGQIATTVSIIFKELKPGWSSECRIVI
jgi:hypothetical protein